MLILLLITHCSSEINLIPVTGTPPAARNDASMEFSSLLNSFILFGGSNNVILYDDLWIFSLDDYQWNKPFVSSEINPSN